MTTDGGDDRGEDAGRSWEGIDIWSLLKFLLGSTTAVAYLIAYGFLSEGAAFQYLGLPQLQADTFEMAEQGARNLIDSFGAMGVWRGLVLFLLALLVSALWWQQDRIRREQQQNQEDPKKPESNRLTSALIWLVEECSRRLQSVRALKWAQFITLSLLFVLVASLVELRVQILPGSQSDLSEKARKVRVWQREQSNWDPRREHARIEALDFEVGINRAGCGALEWLEGLNRSIINGPMYRPWLGVDARNRLARPGEWVFEWFCFTAANYQRDAQMTGPGTQVFGISKRHTEAARKEARSVFGGLFAVALVLFAAVYLLIVWRRRLRRLRIESRPTVGAEVMATQGDHQSFHHASARFVEPLMAILLLLSVALLPSAYGILARGSVGMQQVMVRLKNSTECVGQSIAPANTGIGPHLLAENGLSKTADEFLAHLQQSVLPENASTIDPQIKLAAELAAINRLNRFAGNHLESTSPLTCDNEELESVLSSVADYQAAWSEMYAARPSEKQEYDAAYRRLRQMTDALVTQVAAVGCPEAYAHFWRALPRAAHFSTRSEAAQYVWERWTELQRTRSLVRFGYLVSYPRGKHSDQLLLGDLLSLPAAGDPIRISLQPTPMSCALGIELVPDYAAGVIEHAVQRIRASPITADLTPFERHPGSYALAAMLRLHRDGILDAQRSGVLVTQIGLQAGMLRQSDPLLHHEAVELLLAQMERGIVTIDSELERRSKAVPEASSEGMAASGSGKDAVIDQVAAGEAGSAATSLHFAGGPWVALRVAGLLCDRTTEVPPKNGSGRKSDCESKGLLEVADAGTLRPELWNELGTLVTAMGFLANDAHVSLRQLGMSGAGSGQGHQHRSICTLDAEGLPMPGKCRNRVAHAAAALDLTLAEIVRANVSEGHSHSNRRTACTSLGLSSGASANRALDRQLQALLTDAHQDEPLLRSCMVHAPTGMSPELRGMLREVAIGNWPENPGGPRQEKPPQPPSADVRESALEELVEAGVHFEHELFIKTLGDPDPQIRVAAATRLDRVGPRMPRLLRECIAADAQSQDAKTQDEVSRARNAGRCLRAFRLIEEGERGDDGFSEFLSETLNKPNLATETRNEVCWTLREFSQRNGRSARTWLEGDGRSACPRRWNTSDKTAIAAREEVCAVVMESVRAYSVLQLRQQSALGAELELARHCAAEASGMPLEVRRRIHLAAFSAAEWESASPETPRASEPDNIDERIAKLAAGAMVGEPDSLLQLQRLVLEAGANDSQRTAELAYQALALIGFDKAAAVSTTLLARAAPTPLTYTAAHFVEDGAADTVGSELVRCAGSEALAVSVRGRCLLALTLTAEAYRLDEAGAKLVDSAVGNLHLKAVACRVAAEFGKRGQSSLGDQDRRCERATPSLPAASRERWASHVEAMRVLLVLERESNGPYPGESETFHNEQLQKLRASQAGSDAVPGTSSSTAR